MATHTETIVRIVQAANQFKSSIVLKYNNKFVDAKSLLGLYTTLTDSGEHELHVHGPDEEEAKAAMLEVLGEHGLRVKLVE
ncbi:MULTISPECIES: HPr family phosphocarrier protein [Paenibacillus]|uniref:Phosphocarrier HPr-like protein n=1 Tax=Paenibacillus naphthalenovorans TaxID=162209 RepID=A0A0U2UF99_9BACL|nr:MULTISPECIES: HPr family phosphocarrier protein [Paenibacillus]ALS20577.1 phosphocarrier HPr-like protein [Paenibacillus naphthalenovorans]NTZ18013.1 HPr family phosphocarrier protein [Paenibacillus sp. JMULE4]GCL73133.1 HPr family phosphocarrier protein [Paenibacillus naphthalenovorans]SDI66497.1 phosphocarrier protein [Paenibacillus naphthalenovorans]